MDLDHLCTLIADTLPFDATHAKLSSMPLGGWSNVNLLMSTDERTMVVKLPGRKDALRTEQYTNEFSVYEVLGRDELTPRPLYLGHLNAGETIPFMVLEFVPGTIRPFLAQMSSSDLRALSRALVKMSQAKVSGLGSFSAPSRYLEYLTKRAHAFDEELGGTDRDVIRMVREYDSFEESLGGFLDSTCRWSKRIMHGDLQESNVLFTEKGVMLLDLEYCCIGEPLLDLAYFFCQGESGIISDYPRELVSSEEQRARVDSLISLALMALVSWSIERLALIELNLLEDFLMDVATVRSVSQYAMSKLDALESMKRRWLW